MQTRPEAPETEPPSEGRTLRRPRRIGFRLVLFGMLIIVSGLYVAMRLSNRPRSRDELLPSAVYYKRVRRGMTREAVEYSCGRPEYVQQMGYFGEDAEQWFYSASDSQIEIDIEGGVVKRIIRE